MKLEDRIKKLHKSQTRFSDGEFREELIYILAYMWRRIQMLEGQADNLSKKVDKDICLKILKRGLKT